ncbi:MAG: alpha/beta hydrolase [Gemmatimonadetes bacterium]|nr:alpha/beta hydrolase [Gemmatimonadota bacterium]
MTLSRPMTWLKRLVMLIGVLGLLGYVGLQVSFRSWRGAETNRILSSGKLIALDQGTVEYSDRGEGPVVLGFHGAFGGHDQTLELEGFRVITPSRPGYLRTPLSVGETLEDAATAYAALLDSLGVDRVAVIGVSAGGPTTLQFAAQYPERVWAMVMVSAISKERVRPLPDRGSFARVTDVLFGEGFIDWMWVKLLTRFPDMLLQDPESEIFSSEDQDMLRADKEKLGQVIDVLTKLAPLSKQRLPGYVNDRIQYGRMGEVDPLPIRAPTLVIHGTADPDVEFEHAESTARRTDGAILVPLEGAGHLAFVTHRELMFAEILSFLRAEWESSR